MQAEPLAPLPDSFTLYLTRHATPDRTRSEVAYHILPGPTLAESGQQQARELGAFFHAAGIVYILSSPFERARQTAALAGEICGASLEFTSDLGERQPIESEILLVQRMQRAFTAAAQVSAQLGPVVVLSHGAPVLSLLRSIGLANRLIERCRIYDNRNLIPMAGAWLVERLDGEPLRMRPAFAPHGVILPDLNAGLVEETGV